MVNYKVANKELLIEANNALAEGDYEGFLSHCNKDIKVVIVGDLVLEGKEAVRQWISVNFIDPPKFLDKKLIVEKEYVTAIGQIHMAHRYGGIKHYSYRNVWQFRNGKIAELTAFVIETEE